jgi:hypothetical protein
LHRVADVPVPDLLIKHQTEPVAPFPVLPGDQKRVKNRRLRDRVFLGPEFQPLGQAELWNLRY